MNDKARKVGAGPNYFPIYQKVEIAASSDPLAAFEVITDAIARRAGDGDATAEFIFEYGGIRHTVKAEVID